MSKSAATLPPGYTYPLEALRTVYDFRQDKASSEFEQAAQLCQSQKKQIESMEAELNCWNAQCTAWVQRTSFDPAAYSVALAAVVRHAARLQCAKTVLITLEQDCLLKWESLIAARLRVETLGAHREEQAREFSRESGRLAQNDADDSWMMRKGGNQ